MTPQSQQLVNNFIQWYETSGYKVIGVEKVVYSKKYSYAGTYDCLFEKNGKIILADVKTTKRGYTSQAGIYVEYPAQLGAYALAFEEESGVTVDDLMIINPDKEYGDIQVVLMSQLGISVEQCKQSFLEVYAVYKALQPISFKLKNQNTLKKGAWYAMNKLDQDV